MDLHLIVACDQAWNIGRDGQLLFRISDDLKRFKAVTMGHPIIYGRRTLASFPKGRPLPGRPNLVLSRRPGFTVEGATVVPGLDTLFAELRRIGDPDPFVIGGGEVYAQLLPYCRTAYVTRVLQVFPADVGFPNLDEHPDWMLVEQGELNHVDGLDYRYDCYHNQNPRPLPAEGEPVAREGQGVTAIKPLRLADAAALRNMGVFSGSLKKVQDSIRQLLARDGNGCFLVTGRMLPVLPDEEAIGPDDATGPSGNAATVAAGEPDAGEPMAMTGFLALLPDAFHPEIGRLTVRATHPAFLPALLELACRLAFSVPCFLRIEMLMPTYPEAALRQCKRFGFRTDAIVPGAQLRSADQEDRHLLSLAKTMNRFPGVGVVAYRLGLLSVTGTERQIDSIDFHVTGQPVADPYLQDVFQMWGLLDDKGRLRPSETCVRLIRNDSLPDMVAKAVSQLGEYMEGKRREFDLALNLASGSPFQKAVWTALQSIPYGSTETYLDVALKLADGDLKKARAMSRAVGSACGANPVPVVVPCHRVIGRDGRLTGFSGGIENKEFLLEHELFRRR